MTDSTLNEQELIAAARAWRDDDPDPGTRAELDSLLERGDVAELRERFGSRLEFGTAGLRGILGAGPNRMNRALVRRVTAGLAAYLLEQVPGVRERGVVVGRDGRHLSAEFAEDTAAVLAGAGIPAHVFPGTAPTPVTAFAVSDLGAAAGVMVTASHNPPAYNGYKVYWSNGAQIIPPHDTGISAAIDRVGPVREIPLLEAEAARAEGLLHVIPEALGERYLDGGAGPPEAPGGGQGPVRRLHPAPRGGGEWVRRAFSRAGFARFHMVPEQAEPDGGLPHGGIPQPGGEGGHGPRPGPGPHREGADLVLANDPDADRLAVSRPRRGRAATAP